MKIKYRPEIDGLRSIAVLPVILFHAGLTVFSGGYVGVDVFFVISGYLITLMIITETEEEKFSLIQFYERRIRRIIPALFLVILVCLPLAFNFCHSFKLFYVCFSRRRLKLHNQFLEACSCLERGRMTQCKFQHM